ncbi:YhgE/Pip domain-containing protein [Leuconostoc citreum]|uniref:YhgE/Pip domain-containing protein n=1 Tax=Leuconostoc citreum TaxID=33964 RepID=UPI0032DF40E8
MLKWHDVLEDRRQLITWLCAICIPVCLLIGMIGVVGHRTEQAKQLRVAVVNLDQGGQYQGKQRQVGQEVVATLKRTQQFKTITFKDAKQARQALKDGRVASTVIIPKQLTQQLGQFQQNGQATAITRLVASGRNQFAAKYIQEKLNQVLAQENTMLMVGAENNTIFKNIASQSDKLAQQSNDLQVNLQAIGNGIDSQTLGNLQDTAGDVATKLANYSAQLNDAINAGDSAKTQAMAVAINNLSYTMQSSVVGGISNANANLAQTKALSEHNGSIQSSARAIQSQQTDIADKLKTLFGDNDANKNTSPLTQLMVFKTDDTQLVQQDGQVFLPYLLVIGVALLAALIGLLLPNMEANQDILALEQWWRIFRVTGVLSAVAVILMSSTAVIWHISVGNIIIIIGASLLTSWAMIALVWFLKQCLGLVGWWASVLLLVIQIIFAQPILAATSVTTLMRQLLPLSALHDTLQGVIFAGDIQQGIVTIVIWFMALTIFVVGYYRVKQRRHFKAAIEQ